MKRILGLFALSAALLLACQQPKNSAEEARLAVQSLVETYYEDLLSRRYASCLDVTSGAETMLPEQRKQMEDALRQYNEAQQKEHGGLAKAEVVDMSMQDNRAEVFVELLYTDSVSERIIVPVVLENKVWRME